MKGTRVLLLLLILTGLASVQADSPIQPPPSVSTSGAVTVIVFFDFQCPYCAHLHEVLRRIGNEYGDRIKVVLRYYPIDGECHPLVEKGKGHPYSCYAAKLALASENQGKADGVVSALFDLAFLGPKSASVEAYDDLAAQEGLDLQGAKAFMDTESVKQRLQSDIAEGIQAQIRYTPTLFVGDLKIEGYPGEVKLREYLEAALKPNP